MYIIYGSRHVGTDEEFKHSVDAALLSGLRVFWLGH